MLIGGWLWHARLSALLAGATHTQGTVVAIERPRLQSAHFPVFAFRDAAGSRYEVRSEYPSEKWKEGDAVDVVYDARSPHTAVLTETASQSPAPVAVAFMGLLFIVVGVSTVALAPRFRGSSITWQSRPLPPLVGGGLLVCIGLGLLTAAYLWRAKEASFLRGATHAQGTVVAIEGYRGSHPVFSFRDAQGHQYEIRSAYANQSYRAGDTVDVAYDPRSPYDAVLADSVPQAVARFFLFLLGTVFVASGVSNAWRQYRYQQE